MTKRMNNKVSRKNNRALKVPRMPMVPSPTVIAYTGPIPDTTAETGIVAVLRDVASLNTGAGTSFLSRLDNNPQNTDNWAEYQTAWSEYRVLGIRFRFVPGPTVNSATTLVGPLAHSIVHSQPLPAPTTLAETLSYGDGKLGHTTMPFTREWRMNSVDECNFFTTATPGLSSYTLLTYADGLTAGTSYGVIYRNWLVQFRNSRK